MQFETFKPAICHFWIFKNFGLGKLPLSQYDCDTKSMSNKNLNTHLKEGRSAIGVTPDEKSSSVDGNCP